MPYVVDLSIINDVVLDNLVLIITGALLAYLLTIVWTRRPLDSWCKVKYYDRSIRILEEEQGEWFVNFVIERELAKLFNHYTRDGADVESQLVRDDECEECGKCFERCNCNECDCDDDCDAQACACGCHDEDEDEDEDEGEDEYECNCEEDCDEGCECECHECNCDEDCDEDCECDCHEDDSMSSDATSSCVDNDAGHAVVLMASDATSGCVDSNGVVTSNCIADSTSNCADGATAATGVGENYCVVSINAASPQLLFRAAKRNVNKCRYCD